MSKATYVLGTGLSHNGSACLLKDGEIAVAIEKERITRNKNDGCNDVDAIEYCLSAEGISWSDIDLVVQNSLFGDFDYGNDWYFGPRNIPANVKCVTISHHLAHAYSAIFTSPFDEANILVIDGCGTDHNRCLDVTAKKNSDCIDLFHEVVSYYSFKDNVLTPIHKQFSFPHTVGNADKPSHGYLKDSIGGFYEGLNEFVFGSKSDAGQLMGLAAYGKQEAGPVPTFSLDGLNVIWDHSWTKKLKLRDYTQGYFEKDFQYFADLAKFSQTNIELSVVALVNKLYEVNQNCNLCFAGGVALNILANSKIVRETPFKNLYVPPPTNDAGVAIGCAYYGWIEVLKRERVRHGGSPFLGKVYDTETNEVVRAVLSAVPNVKVSIPADLNTQVAKLIGAGKIVGWYKGGAEIGPRALGHRSLLGNPCDPGMKDRINNAIKNRPDFRPFAPSVLAEDAAVYFDIDRPSPYMLLVFDVREEWRDKIPAVIQVDGTARVQTVSESDDKDFYELLKEVKKETGIGMVLNTSFNRRHEPIVERPEEAVQMFLNTPMDALVLGPYLLTK